ncbi:MAG: helix-turn-helix domain-containing protein [Acetobacteraceae bacterium]|nr:helix-turn-helix domain-containing protein [Acetobacteraceae bacterium]
MESKPIRSFARGLAVLSALNRHGGATALTLARESGVPRATVYRLLQTLLDEGYIGRGTADDRFYLRLKVRSLSEGFADEQWIGEIAGPAIAELTRRISWPSDLVTLAGPKMVIHETTHRIAPLSIDRNMVGQELPILGSASGLAYIAFAPKGERETLLALLAQSSDPRDALARDPAQASRLIEATRRRGYGLRQGGAIWPHTGTIAMPVRVRRRVLGCINVIWMARVLSAKEGVSRCLKPLWETRQFIEQRVAESRCTRCTSAVGGVDKSNMPPG